MLNGGFGLDSNDMLLPEKRAPRLCKTGNRSRASYIDIFYFIDIILTRYCNIDKTGLLEPERLMTVSQLKRTQCVCADQHDGRAGPDPQRHHLR